MHEFSNDSNDDLGSLGKSLRRLRDGLEEGGPEPNMPLIVGYIDKQLNAEQQRRVGYMIVRFRAWHDAFWDTRYAMSVADVISNVEVERATERNVTQSSSVPMSSVRSELPFSILGQQSRGTQNEANRENVHWWRRSGIGAKAVFVLALICICSSVYAGVTNRQLASEERSHQQTARGFEESRSVLAELDHGLQKSQSLLRSGKNEDAKIEIDKLLQLTQGEKERLLKYARQQPVFHGDKSVFLADVNFPDGSRVKVGQKFTKTWEIKNAGSVIWTSRFLSRQGAADSVGRLKSPELVLIPNTEPDKSVRISVDLVAPLQPGPCYAEWKIVDENGRYLLPTQLPLFIALDVVNE